MSDDSQAQVQAPRREKRPRDPEQWVHRSMGAYRNSAQSLEFRPGPAFFEIADPIVQSRRTLLGYDRLYVFWQAIRNVALVPGVAAEIGSYRGGSAYFLARAFERVTGAEVPMHVFDTFEGHPAGAITPHDPFHEPGQFGRTSYEDVKTYLSPFHQLQIHKGDVSGSLPGLAETAYRFVHIDTDLYQPTIVCLEYFVPRLSPGGVIIVDDYASGKCPGVAKAVVEYLEHADHLQVWDMRTEQLMLVKP
jgi:O-methyltransferase